MAALSTIIGAVGLGIGAAGTVVQYNAQRTAAAAQQRQERIRERQMELQATRQRRDAIRQSMRARSIALTTASDQGAGSGSGIAGGLGQIAAQGNSNLQGINQGVELGAEMFSTNRQIAGAQTLASFGSGLSSLGGSIYGASDTLGRIGNYFTQRRG